MFEFNTHTFRQIGSISGLKWAMFTLGIRTQSTRHNGPIPHAPVLLIWPIVQVNVMPFANGQKAKMSELPAHPCQLIWPIFRVKDRPFTTWVPHWPGSRSPLKLTTSRPRTSWPILNSRAITWVNTTQVKWKFLKITQGISRKRNSAGQKNDIGYETVNLSDSNKIHWIYEGQLKLSVE